MGLMRNNMWELNCGEHKNSYGIFFFTKANGND